MSPQSTAGEEEVRSDQEVFGDEEAAGQESGVAGGSTANRTPRGTSGVFGTSSQVTVTVDIACDRCRKSKSRCTPAAGGDKRCKACVAAGAGARTFHSTAVASVLTR